MNINQDNRLRQRDNSPISSRTRSRTVARQQQLAYINQPVGVNEEAAPIPLRIRAFISQQAGQRTRES